MWFLGQRLAQPTVILVNCNLTQIRDSILLTVGNFFLFIGLYGYPNRAVGNAGSAVVTEPTDWMFAYLQHLSVAGYQCSELWKLNQQGSNPEDRSVP